MKPGDILLWRDTQFGVHRAWRVLSIVLGAEQHEGLVELQSMFERPGSDASGAKVQTVLVPEVLTRGLAVFSDDGISVVSN